MPQYILQPAKTSVSARSSPLNTVDVSRGGSSPAAKSEDKRMFSQAMYFVRHTQINAPVYFMRHRQINAPVYFMRHRQINAPVYFMRHRQINAPLYFVKHRQINAPVYL